uniref:CCHC-type domain-containing protein n=1 Tax=Lactuca sativa TaxID=4236 RepID=A0A9R1UH79_LACSA|nr:hypothetical protein LSAT_V11C900503090 [Lactuca sativa]
MGYHIVQLQPYWSFNDVCQLALKKTETYKGTLGGTLANQFNSIRSEGSSNPSVTPTRNPPRCFKCGGLGHFAPECPNTQLVTLIEDTPPKYDSDGEIHKDEDTKIILSPYRPACSWHDP